MTSISISGYGHSGTLRNDAVHQKGGMTDAQEMVTQGSRRWRYRQCQLCDLVGRGRAVLQVRRLRWRKLLS